MTASLFQTIGLSEAKAKETLKNPVLSGNLEEVIGYATCESSSAELVSKGPLLYHIASKVKAQIRHHLKLLTHYVVAGPIDSELRLTAAIEYLMAHPEADVNKAALEEAFGMGVVVTPDMIEGHVEKAISDVKAELLEKRYRYPVGLLMAEVRKQLKWADGKAIKNEIEVQLLDTLGPKTEADLAPVAKAAKTPASSNKAENKAQAKVAQPKPQGGGGADDGASSIAELMKTKVHFHQPGKNFLTDGYAITDKTMWHMEQHLKRTGGQVRTRFPPEPNGILHIGHAKAININFGYAAAHDGICFLRYDDTNPEKEEEKFFTGILDAVQWLGYKPYRITHSSDHFEQLYEWAKVLIQKDLAYVCHQRVDDIRGFNPPPSPWRSRPTSESLQLFEDMKNGKFDEGQATLRLKLTLEEGKQDPVAYRIKFAHHHRTGDRWCIYPTYDYTHCLCDSLEDITHSLCTKEFQNRRSSYYWLCNAVDTYCPVQWEYGRLNVGYTVVSKRKIAQLISSGVVRDWDDPRLFTLTALRRRGFTPQAINSFCAKLGLTGAQMTIEPAMLEASVRTHLNQVAARTMVILQPLKLNIVNFASFGQTMHSPIQVPNFPDRKEDGSHEIAFGPTIYIEQSDFKLQADKNFRRLTRDQPVGLRYAGLGVSFVRQVSDTELDVECVGLDKMPKAFIHWVCEPAKVEVRLYDQLFKHKCPEDENEVPGGFLSDINEASLTVLTEALCDRYLLSANVFDKFQFERQGYFSVDPDSTQGRLVFNRTVSLKEDSGK